MNVSWLFFWNHKNPVENAWHPRPGANPTRYVENYAPPWWLARTDLEAAVVDTAPFVAGAGGAAHMAQLNRFGLDRQASVFRNRTTMIAMHRTVALLLPIILMAQAAGVEYRYYVPRWAHERERRRDEEEVRKHVDVGMGVGAFGWVARMYVLGVGKRYWAPLDVVMGGALADLMHREWWKAHGF